MASDAALTQNDDYIVCDECDKPCIFGDCPDHGPLEWIDDCQVQQKTQARASLPSNLYLVPSAVGQGQMGVFAKTRIEKRVMFGPFKGQRIPAKEINFGEDPNFVHTWDVLEGGKVSHAIDGTNEQHSNWMRFVNCAHHDKEQNLVVMQYRGEIYYKTLVPVEEGSELLVWYKDSCVRTMDTSVESSSQKDQRGHDFVCDVCGLVFAGPNFLLRHKSVRCPGISETSDRADEAESLEKETSVDAGSTVPSLEENESSYVIVHIGPNANENNITRIEAEKDLPYVVVHVEPAPSSDKAGNVKRGKRTLVDEKKINSSKKPKLANVRQRSADSARKAKKVVSKGRLTKARRTAQSKVANARVTATKKSLPSKKTPLGTKRKTTSTSSGSKPSKSRRGTVEKVNKKRTGQNKSAASSKSTGSRPRKVSNSAKKSKNKVTEDEAMANKSEKKIAVKAKKIRTVKVPEEKPVITCAVCSRNFKWKSQLDYHMRSHAPEKEFKCSFCDKGLSQMSSLKRHLRVHSGEKPYECEQCGKRFPERAKLILHQRKHTGEQPEKKYKCTVCDRGFTLSANMKTHMRTHTGEKPYPCPQCGKAFSRSSDIISHLRSHTGERPYKCSHCQKAFTMISHRNRHEIIHSGEKPFKCDVCGKGFTQPNSVKAHLKVHARRQALLEGDQNDPTQQQREGVSIGAAMQTIEKAGPCESGKGMSQNNGLEQLEMACAPMIGSRDVASTEPLQSGRTGQAQFEDLQQGSVHAGDSAQPGVPYRGGANLLQLDTTRVLQAGRVQLNNVEVDTTRVMQGGHVQLNNAEVDGITRQAISLRDGTELTTISAQQLQLRCTNEQFDIVSSQMNSRELLPLACVTQGINENEHDDVHVQLELAQNIGEDQLHVDEREEIAPTLLAL